VDFNVWTDAKLDDVLAERARVMRETWDWLQALRAEVTNRVAILKKAETAIRAALAELEQRRERVVAGLRKSMAKVHAECMAASASRGESYFEAEMEADDAVVAIDAERTTLQANLEWVADRRRRADGHQSDVLMRQEEIFKRLVN
jgi:acetyl-CoA carboxylase carboxyltransferase component